MTKTIKYNSEYSAEQWAEMVYKFEYSYAQSQIAKGVEVDIVLEQMSKRITEKMMLPEIQKIKKSHSEFDVEEGRHRYEQIMRNHKIKN